MTTTDMDTMRLIAKARGTTSKFFNPEREINSTWSWTSGIPMRHQPWEWQAAAEQLIQAESAVHGRDIGPEIQEMYTGGFDGSIEQAIALWRSRLDRVHHAAGLAAGTARQGVLDRDALA